MLDDIEIVDAIIESGCGTNIVSAWQRIKELVEAQATSTNSARDEIAVIIFDACREFDEAGTINVNDYADQVLRCVATAPVAAQNATKCAGCDMESICKKDKPTCYQVTT